MTDNELLDKMKKHDLKFYYRYDPLLDVLRFLLRRGKFSIERSLDKDSAKPLTFTERLNGVWFERFVDEFIYFFETEYNRMSQSGHIEELWVGTTRDKYHTRYKIL